MDLSLNKLPGTRRSGCLRSSGLEALRLLYFYAAPVQLEMAEREKRLTSLRADINKGMTTATKLTEFRAK